MSTHAQEMLEGRLADLRKQISEEAKIQAQIEALRSERDAHRSKMHETLEAYEDARIERFIEVLTEQGMGWCLLGDHGRTIKSLIVCENHKFRRDREPEITVVCSLCPIRLSEIVLRPDLDADSHWKALIRKRGFSHNQPSHELEHKYGIPPTLSRNHHDEWVRGSFTIKASQI